MKVITVSLLFIFLFLFVGCKPSESLLSNKKEILKNNYITGNSITLYKGINDTSFVKLKNFSGDFAFDMKYATTDNFLKQKVYECDECYLRMKTIKNLMDANAEFMQKGYRIKLFDCYRPLDIQRKMWTIVPNADYVADPQKGSIHNRGGAIDITLVDKDGNELDMGTPFDFFGIKASHNNKDLPNKVLKNRAYLKEVMLKHHFKSFDSEWWHYNLEGSTKDPLANFKWKCD